MRRGFAVPAAVIVGSGVVIALLVWLVVSSTASDSDTTGAEPGVTVSGATSTGGPAELDDCPETDVDAAAIDDGLPDLVLPCMTGSANVNLAGLTGQPMVLAVWASWCGPCHEEVPYIQQAHAEFGSQLQVVGVDYEDTSQSDADAFLTEAGATFAQVVDEKGSVYSALALRGIPTTLFVDADGRIVFATSAIDSYDDLAGMIEEHLGVEPATP